MGLWALLMLLTYTQQPVWADSQSGLLHDAVKGQKWMQEIRWKLHSQPELAYEEIETSKLVRQSLKELGIPFKHPYARTGVVATVGKGSPRIALRADMDALPIEEDVDVPWKSLVKGKMHACGHDAHTAMLLGAAKLLKAREASLPGTVVLIFQPAEEGRAGGKRMVEEGALKGVSVVHGIHVWPSLPAGVIGTRVGTIMAASDRFTVAVRGRGGHAAIPHMARDPVVAGTAIVNSLQALVSRETSPTGSAVVSVSRFNTGPGASNVIPDEVQLSGTIRALDKGQFDHLRERVTQVMEGVAAVHGCSARVDWSEQAYGPTVNHREVVSLVERAAIGLVGQPGMRQLEEPSMAAEDFSFMADATMGSYTFLGIYNTSARSMHGLHSAKFQMDDAQLPLGAALHTAVALGFFEQGQAAADRSEL